MWIVTTEGKLDFGRAIAQAVSRRPLTAEARVRAWVDVGFVLDKVALGQSFLRFTRFSDISIIQAPIPVAARSKA
jgi:hypothetical protein